MQNLTRVENLEEPVYLKKGMFGYRVVYPIRNPDGSLNWINVLFGGYENLIKLIIILFIFFCFIYGVQEMMGSCKDMAKNPCKYTNLDCTRYYDLYANLDNGLPSTSRLEVDIEDVSLNE